MVAGRPRDALVDITGGVGEVLHLDSYKTEEQKMELFDILHESIENRSLMSASINVSYLKGTILAAVFPAAIA